MRDRGVLELVDQDVADAVVEREEQVARRVGRAEGAHGALRELGEVGLAALGEDHLELRHREGKHADDRIQNFPLRVAVALGRHAEERLQGPAKLLVA